MKKLFIALIVFMIGCKTTSIDHATGDRNPTWNTRHLNKVHKTPWHAGNDLITPVGFKPVKVSK